jgi:hypothetical protein
LKARRTINYWYAITIASHETVVLIQAHSPGQARRIIRQRWPQAEEVYRVSKAYLEASQLPQPQ